MTHDTSDTDRDESAGASFGAEDGSAGESFESPDDSAESFDPADVPAAGSLERGDLTAESQAALEELLFRLADDEFVHAERATEWQIYAPTLESDLALANIAQDEFGHARLWYDLLEELGYTEAECIWERPPAEWRHATLVERPFPDGGWGNAVLRGYLYDVAERIRLEATLETSYAPLADRVGKALDEEEYHREHAYNWLERLTSDPEGRDRVQTALDALFPHALTLFVPATHETAIRRYGFRRESTTAMREEWLETIVPTLESFGLDVPDVDEAAASLDVQGRDGTHTDAWSELYAAFTATYRELEPSEPVTLRNEEVS